jgi:hypothetical protein
MNTDQLEQLNILDLSDDALSMIISRLSTANIAKLSETNTTFRDVIKNYKLVDNIFEKNLQILDTRNLEVFDENKLDPEYIKFYENDEVLSFTSRSRPEKTSSAKINYSITNLHFDYEIKKFGDRYKMFIYKTDDEICIFVLIRNMIYTITKDKSFTDLHINQIVTDKIEKVFIAKPNSTVYILTKNHVIKMSLLFNYFSNKNLDIGYKIKYFRNRFLIYGDIQIECVFFYKNDIFYYGRNPYLDRWNNDSFIEKIFAYRDKKDLPMYEIRAFHETISCKVFDEQIIIDFSEKLSAAFDEYFKNEK